MSNYKFKTTNIRGKQYVEVNERIKFFRQEDQYKDWTIMSEFCLLYTSPSPRDRQKSRMPSSA